MSPTDAELLQAARQDHQAFREFYDRYAVWVRSWFQRETGSESAARERLGLPLAFAESDDYDCLYAKGCRVPRDPAFPPMRLVRY